MKPRRRRPPDQLQKDARRLAHLAVLWGAVASPAKARVAAIPARLVLLDARGQRQLNAGCSRS